MKKSLQITLLIAFALFVFVSCSNSSDSDSGDNRNIITAQIDMPIRNKITLINPLPEEANVTINIISYNEQVFEIDIDNSSCSTFNLQDIGNLQDNKAIDGTLPAKKGFCDINYTFTPKQLATELLQFDVTYSVSADTICPEKEYKPSIQQIRDSVSSASYPIYHYAINGSGTTSPDIIDVDMGSVIYNNSDGYSNITPKTFHINVQENDVYKFKMPAYYTITSDNDQVCSISKKSDNSSTEHQTGDCNLTVKIDDETSDSDQVCSINEESDYLLTAHQAGDCNLTVKINDNVTSTVDTLSKVIFKPKDDNNNLKQSYTVLFKIEYQNERQTTDLDTFLSTFCQEVSNGNYGY